MAKHLEETSPRTRQLSRAAAGSACLALLLIASGCGSTPKDTRAADETTIRALDAHWAKSAAAKDLDATVGYYSDDASLLSPNSPIASDKQYIRESCNALLSPDASARQFDKVRKGVQFADHDLGGLARRRPRPRPDARRCGENTHSLNSIRCG